MKVIAKQPIKHSGKTYTVDSVVPMEKEEAERLVSLGYVEISDEASTTTASKDESKAEVERLTKERDDARANESDLQQKLKDTEKSLKQAQAEAEKQSKAAAVATEAKDKAEADLKALLEGGNEDSSDSETSKKEDKPDENGEKKSSTKKS